MEKRIVIVGGGVIGLNAAWCCLDRGLRVTVIDRQPAQRDGCSYGNAGMIVPSHFVPLAAPGMVSLGLKWMWNPESPFYIRPRLSPDLLGWAWRFWRACSARHVQLASPLLCELNLASRAIYERLAEAWSNEFGLERRGLLMLCKTQHALDDEARVAEQARRLGLPAEVHDRESVERLEPGMRMDVAGAILFPQDCHLTPQRFMGAMERRLSERGCEFLWESEVTGCERRDRRLHAIRTTRGDVEADEFVLAAGSWSTTLARLFDLRLPMQAGKGYSLTLPRPKQKPERCAIFTEARVAVTPMGSALRFGGTMELTGLNETIDPRRVNGIIKSVSRYYPDFGPDDFAGVAPWRGLRPCSPDGLPFLGRTNRWQNLLVATGHAMMGLSLAPITGEIVARLATGEPAGFDLRLMSPDRFV